MTQLELDRLEYKRKRQLRNMSDADLLEVGNNYRTAGGTCPNEAIPALTNRADEIDFIIECERVDPDTHWEGQVDAEVTTD